MRRLFYLDICEELYEKDLKGLFFFVEQIVLQGRDL